MEYIFRQYNYSEFTLKKTEIYKLMGYDGVPNDPRIGDIVDNVITEIASKVTASTLFTIVDGYLCDSSHISLGDVILSPGKIIVDQLKNANTFCVFVTTAGKRMDDYVKELHLNNMLVEEYIVDLIGSYIAEKCVDKIIQTLEQRFDAYLSLGYSPGYCGWDLKEQCRIFSMLPPNPAGIKLMPSQLMLPIKSTSGIIGIGDTPFPKVYKCKLCGYKKCYKYRNVL